MATFRVLVEYAYSCDLVLDVEAESEEQALEDIGDRAYAPSISAAIGESFPENNPQILGAEMLVTDVRTVGAAPAA